MSKLAHSNQETMDQVEERYLLNTLQMDEAFSIFSLAGIKEIKWSEEYNLEYALWQYFNLK